MLEFVKIKSNEDVDFQRAMKLYNISFPIHEQRSLNQQLEVMKEASYNFEIIYSDKMFVGLILYWTQGEVAYVEHYAIDSKVRGNNMGTKALSLFCDRFETIILEIDPPMDEISIRREGFYSRLGFKQNVYEHFHPPYKTGYKPHKLVLLSYPNTISKASYVEFKEYLDKEVMKVR